MTVWTSNWLDVERRPVQLMLLGLMFGDRLPGDPARPHGLCHTFAFRDHRLHAHFVNALLIALGAAFVGTVSLWWCYFHRAERLGIDALEGVGDASRVVAIGNYTLIAARRADRGERGPARGGDRRHSRL